MQNLLFGISLVIISFCSLFAENWNQFRGPTGQGHASTVLPQKWSSESSNLRWRTPIDGKAWSSPIQVDNQIVVTNARTLNDGSSIELEVISLDGETGQFLWNKRLFSYEEMPRIHRKNSYASPTPFFDGESIYVHFGNLGSARMTKSGEVLWKKVFDYSPVHGGGSSPIIYGDLLLFSADGASDPSIYAINNIMQKLFGKKEDQAIQRKTFLFVLP